MKTENSFVAGLTFKSLIVSVLCMLISGMLIQYGEIIVGMPQLAEHTLPISVILVIVALTLTVGIVATLFKIRILSRAEMLCILFSMLLAAPLMTQGFWHRIVSMVATMPREKQFDKLDAFSDRLWPHGSNILSGALGGKGKNSFAMVETGNIQWVKTEYDEGKFDVLPRLVNTGNTQVSSIRVTVPLKKNNGTYQLEPLEPYLASVLVRATGLAAQSNYYLRVYADSSTRYSEMFSSAIPAQKTVIHKTGFIRNGSYNVMLAADAQNSVTLEYGLFGPGTVEFYDSKVFSVAALEDVYKSKKMVNERDLALVPPQERGRIIVKPDNMFSLKGLVFLCKGYIPLKSWGETFLSWSWIIVLLLFASLAVNVVMRRQWLENERYSLPLTKVPLALLTNDKNENSPWAGIWANRIMWIGLFVALVWVLMRGWAFYDPSVPDLKINVGLKQFFPDPSWGKMWDSCGFKVYAIFFALCLFMELNILISLVIGYFMFISLFWVGEMTGLKVLDGYGYPFADQQTIGSFVAYGLATLFFVRRYLFSVVKDVIKGRKESSQDEIFSYRTAFLILGLAIVGAAGWAYWVGASIMGIVLFFLFLLLVGFVSSKIRAEAGTPFGYFTPNNAMLFLALFGGMRVFGANSMIVCLIATFIISQTVFFLIPGAQLEFMELGRRWKINPRHILYVCIIGIIGGLVIGGWVFLSNGYALGGDSSRYRWAFDTKLWWFTVFNTEMTFTNQQIFGDTGVVATASNTFDWRILGYIYSGVITIVLVVLRQLFAGFWFHPLGFILGTPGITGGYIWGSALLAWLVRMGVLRIGGAATVREKLMPFAIGVFLGAVLGFIILWGYGGYLTHLGIDRIYGDIP